VSKFNRNIVDRRRSSVAAGMCLVTLVYHIRVRLSYLPFVLTVDRGIHDICHHSRLFGSDHVHHVSYGHLPRNVLLLRLLHLPILLPTLLRILQSELLAVFSSSNKGAVLRKLFLTLNKQTVKHDINVLLYYIEEQERASGR